MHEPLPQQATTDRPRKRQRDLKPGDRVKFANHDRVYILGDHGELRRATPKVKGKRARAADRRRRRQRREEQARQQVRQTRELANGLSDVAQAAAQTAVSLDTMTAAMQALADAAAQGARDEAPSS